MTKEIIHLTCVSDEHYTVLLAVLLKSIEINHHSGELIHVHIVSDGITEKSQRKLIDSLSSEKIKLFWTLMKDAIPATHTLPKDKSTYPMNISARIYAPYYIPQNVEKAIYLDVDMLMLADVSQLWKIDLEGRMVAAAKDTNTNIGGGNDPSIAIALPPGSILFNSGLMVMDLKKWREGNLSEKVINIINDNIEYAIFPDQYGLNVAFANNWLMLDDNWNAFTNERHNNPFLLHFYHRKPIYKSYSNDPYYKDLFFEYVEKTQWKGLKPIGEFKRYTKKMLNVIKKRIPF